jgi:iron complex outermembrane recepter protein
MTTNQFAWRRQTRAAMLGTIVLSGFTALAPNLAGAEQRSRESDGEVLEEIVVTATRRTTSIQAAPLSVTALTGDQLRAIGARDLPDYFALVPGLSYSDDGWTRRVTIRGVGSGSFVEPRPLSALYLDDTPMMTISGPPQLGQIAGPQPEVVDLARIEVLRGPQGALFGTSAMGGAIRMITNPPDPDGWRADADVDLSSTSHGDDNYQFSGMINLPLAPGTAALRAVGFVRNETGFIDDVRRGIANVNSAKTTGGRAALLWRPTSKATLTLRGHYQSRESEGLNWTDNDIGQYSQARYVAESNEETWELLQLAIEYDLEWAQFLSATSYMDRKPAVTLDETLFAQDFFELELPNPSSNEFRDSVRDFVQEVRLTSRATGRVSWLVGAYYHDEDRRNIQDFRSPGFDELTGGAAASFGYPDTLAHTQGIATQQQRALYGQLSFGIADGWQATLGGRWFDLREERSSLFDGVAFGGPIPREGSVDQADFTGQAGVAYRPNEDTLFFVNAAEGFRPGGANFFSAAVVEHCSEDLAELGLPAPPATFASDSIWSYELGAKRSWPAQRLAANGTVYHIDWSDLQTQEFLDGCGVGFFQNAGRVEIDGLEIEAVWQPAESLELTLGTAYVDARLAQNVPNVSGEKGEHIPIVPAWSLNLAADADVALPLGVVFASASFQYIDGSWSHFDDASRIRLPSRELLSLRTGLRRDTWQLELYVDNLLDDRGAVFASMDGLGVSHDSLTQPRTVGLRVQLRFAEALRAP